MKNKQTAARSIDKYIAGFPRPAQAVLKRVRRTIRKAVPGSEEAIAYGIPVFKIKGRAAIYFAGWKQHYSLYPSGDRLVAAFRKELAPYEFNNKGTIRFPISEPVPVRLIERIARFRAKEIAQDLRAVCDT
jgi:uncharacterized protein YdhG (YjbR/CyaY superfamily)